MKPMLLAEYPDYRKRAQQESYVFTQPKLDGWRAYANTKTGTIYSRSGNVLNLSHISTAIKATSREGSPEWIDGELYRHGCTLGEIQSMIKRRDTGLQYHIFDCIDGHGFGERFSMLSGRNDESGTLQTTITTIIKPCDVMKHYKAFLRAGYEGAVIRIDGRGYEQYRSFQALKMKPEIM
jgi:ATP-dependent DNA ligase